MLHNSSLHHDLFDRGLAPIGEHVSLLIKTFNQAALADLDVGTVFHEIIPALARQIRECSQRQLKRGDRLTKCPFSLQTLILFFLQKKDEAVDRQPTKEDFLTGSPSLYGVELRSWPIILQ